jgi:hypothetical protein
MASILTTAEKVRAAQRENVAVRKRGFLSSGVTQKEFHFNADRYANVQKRTPQRAAGPLHSSQLQDLADAKKRALVAAQKKANEAAKKAAEPVAAAEAKKRGRKPK